MPRVIVVVPCYNEAQRLNTRRLLEFVDTAPGIDLLLVNDGSRDSTPEIIEQLHEANPQQFRFLHLAANCGKAEAVRQGMLLALRSRPKYIGFWDADLATPLEQVADFIRVLDAKSAIDVVIGTRMVMLGHEINRQPLRCAAGRAFSTLAARALATPIRDTQCGAKLFRVTPDLVAALAEPYLSRWLVDVEIFARLRRSRKTAGRSPLAQIIYEYPLDAWRDMVGSKFKLIDMLNSVVELARIYLAYRRTPLALPSAAAPAATGAAAHGTVFPGHAAVERTDARTPGDPGSRKQAA